jgi:Resolvase, N terminal domain
MPNTNGHGSEASERVALYMRVSSEEQRDRETIEIQREFLEQYCRLYRLEIAEIYTDEAYLAQFRCTKGPTASGSWKMHGRTDSRQCSSPS